MQITPKFLKDISDIEDNKILQNDMQELENGSDKWLLRFHPDKCKVLSAVKQKTQQYKYTLCNKELQYSNKEKDIGIVVDNQLNFEDHMNEKINKANSIMGLIRPTFTYIDEPTFLMLYKALVRPHLEYMRIQYGTHLRKNTLHH